MFVPLHLGHAPAAPEERSDHSSARCNVNFAFNEAHFKLSNRELLWGENAVLAREIGSGSAVRPRSNTPFSGLLTLA